MSRAAPTASDVSPLRCPPEALDIAEAPLGNLDWNGQSPKSVTSYEEDFCEEDASNPSAGSPQRLPVHEVNSPSGYAHSIKSPGCGMSIAGLPEASEAVSFDDMCRKS